MQPRSTDARVLTRAEEPGLFPHLTVLVGLAVVGLTLAAITTRRRQALWWKPALAPRWPRWRAGRGAAQVGVKVAHLADESRAAEPLVHMASPSLSHDLAATRVGE